MRAETPTHRLGDDVRRLLKSDDAKEADGVTVSELARCADESTHMATRLTAHTGPNARANRPPTSEARRVPASDAGGRSGSARG